MNPARVFPALIACFFASGLAALVYQTAWTRQLSFVFGASELAVATVLAAYMAGLALGAAAAGRIGPRIANPVRVYGWLELGIAVSALAVPFGMKAATGVLLHAFGDQAGLPAAADGGIGFFYASVAFLLLMIPTALMGATLPLLARHVVQNDDELGNKVGRLYAWNTAGAVAGTALTAFVLLPAFGLGRTVWVAVAVNGLVFVIASALARSVGVSAGAAPSARETRTGNTWILPVIAMSGVVSFSGEVLWTRLLSHVLGGSVYAFATMLSSVLLGIAIGARIASRFASRPDRAARAFVVVQLGAALFTALAFAAADNLADLAPVGALTGAGLARGAGLCAALLLPSALCFGATYPLAVRIFAGAGTDPGSASARVYAWNTGGAIVGALSAAFFVLPALGFHGTLGASVLVSGLLAAWTAWRVDGAGRGVASAGAALVIAGAVLWLGPPERLLQHGPLGSPSPNSRLEWLSVGRSATVTINRHSGRFDVRTNGLPESKVRTAAAPAGRLLTATWMNTLPSVLRPETRNLVVVGLGGGVVVENVPESVERIHVVELEAEVVAANEYMAPRRAIDPLADPRVEIVENDARTALLLSGERYDAIVAQASHPWTAGSAHLYTREFFSLAASRMRPGGVFVQWMGAAFVDESLLRTLVATLVETWPYVRVYRPYAANFLFVASAQPFPDDEAVSAFHATHPSAARLAGLLRPDDLAAALYLDAAASRAFAEGAAVATDDRNWLQMRSPFVRGSRESVAAQGPPPTGMTPAPMTLGRIRSLAERSGAPLNKALLRELPAEDRPVAGALRALATGRRLTARSLLQPFLAEHPGDRLARALHLQIYAVAPELPNARALEPPFSVGETIVADAIDARRDGDLALLLALKPGLAAVPWPDPLHRAALELWIDAGVAEARRRPGSEERGVAFRRLVRAIDEALRVYRADADLLLRRAEIGFELDDAELTLVTMETAFEAGGARDLNPRLVLEFRTILASMKMPGELRLRRVALAEAMTRALN